MGSGRFPPDDPIIAWLKEVQDEGDFICRPANFGSLLAGYSTQAAGWEASNTYPGIIAPTWFLATYLLCDPNWLTSDSLWWFAGGDRYCFGDSHEFDSAPYFCRFAYGLDFDADRVGLPFGHYGSVLVLR